MTIALAPATIPDGTWPAADIVVLRGRPLRAGTDRATLSRFGDPVWHIKPAHPDAHLNITPLTWSYYPTIFERPFKTFFLAALDHPYPGNPDTVQRGAERASVATFRYWFVDLQVFAKWLISRDVHRLCDVTERHLDAYRTYVLNLARKTGRKADLLAAVRTLWLYGPHLPAEGRLATGYPWPGAPEEDLKSSSGGRENKTPRIAPATMTALLAWALRVIEEVGPDVRDAWVAHQQFRAGIHPSQAEFHGLATAERIARFIARCRRDGTPLPGHPTKDGQRVINYSGIQRMVQTTTAFSFTSNQKRVLQESGLPIAEDAYVGQIAGRIDGRPWREAPIAVSDLRNLIRMVAAACFVVICYLSGARPGEVLNLRPGCRARDEDTGELLIIGRRGKGYDRASLAETDSTPTDRRPWVVVAPVHDAIALLESFGDYAFLFPASFTNAHTKRPNDFNARQAESITRDLEAFVDWVNTTFGRPGADVPIPPDPTKHLHASRFRRTLAYFIVRRPRGLVAAALQYAHVHTKVTLSYAGRDDSSWMDDVHLETLEMVLEQNEHDAQLLREGEHVSAAGEYRHRVQTRARFAGRVVTAGRSVERLLDQANPNIHHGEGMTCVWRRETAETAGDVSGELPGATLLGHMNRANPHWAALETGSVLLLTFTGPHSYVSPTVYEKTPAAPTWNFTAVHVRGVVEKIDSIEETLGVVQSTVRAYEGAFGDGWDMTESLDYFRKIVPDVGAFRFTVTGAEGMFKLSQEQPGEVRERVRDAFGQSGCAYKREVAGLMNRLP